MPAVDKPASRAVYKAHAERWNAQFYQDDKFVRSGSRKLYLQHSEVWFAALAILNSRLKHRNFTQQNKEIDMAEPFGFWIRMVDFYNLLQKNNKEFSAGVIKRAIERFQDAGFILSYRWSRMQNAHWVEISPESVVFLNISKSMSSDGRNAKCNVYTNEINLLNNKKSNFSNLNECQNLHTNSNFILGTKIKKNTPAELPDTKNKDSQKSNKPFYETVTEKESSGAGDLRNLSEKTENTDFLRVKLREISGENCENLVPDAKRSAKKGGESLEDVEKHNIIKNFYIMFLKVFFSIRFNLYTPENTDSEYFIYSLQALNTIKNDAEYFGNCQSIEDFKYKAEFLHKTLVKSNLWLKKRNFNTDFLFPNQVLAGQGRFSFKNAVKYTLSKTSHNEYKPVEGKFSDKQFAVLLKKTQKELFYMKKTPDVFANYFIVREINKEIEIEPHLYDWKTYQFMRNFLNYGGDKSKFFAETTNAKNKSIKDLNKYLFIVEEKMAQAGHAEFKGMFKAAELKGTTLTLKTVQPVEVINNFEESQMFSDFRTILKSTITFKTLNYNLLQN